MAQRLKRRGGAVTAALQADGLLDVVDHHGGPPAPRVSAVAEGTPHDLAAIAAMSQHPGFPGVGYSGG